MAFWIVIPTRDKVLPTYKSVPATFVLVVVHIYSFAVEMEKNSLRINFLTCFMELIAIGGL